MEGELCKGLVINKQASEKLSKKGAELKRRTGKTPKRDLVKQKLTKIFKHSNSKQDLFDLLQEEGFELYVRGKTIGVKEMETDRKYRLKTLGLLDTFNSMSDKISLEEETQQQKTQDKTKSQQEKSKQKKSKQSESKEKSRKDEIDKIAKERLEKIKELRRGRS